MKPLKSICILRLSSIGDVTHIVPIINTIKKNSVETSITWVIGSTEYELVKTMPNINFIVIDKNNKSATIIIYISSNENLIPVL